MLATKCAGKTYKLNIELIGQCSLGIVDCDPSPIGQGNLDIYCYQIDI